MTTSFWPFVGCSTVRKLSVATTSGGGAEGNSLQTVTSSGFSTVT